MFTVMFCKRGLLFLLCTYDIVNDIGANIRSFAYDTSLFIIEDNPMAAAVCLNSDLNVVSQYSVSWLELFSSTETESLLTLTEQACPTAFI